MPNLGFYYKSQVNSAKAALQQSLQYYQDAKMDKLSVKEKERLLRNLTYTRAEYIGMLEKYNADYPANPIAEDRRLLTEAALDGDETAPINGRRVSKLAVPGELLARDRKDDNGNPIPETVIDKARRQTRWVFENLYQTDIDAKIKSGEKFDFDLFSQSVNHRLMAKGISLALSDPADVKAMNRARLTEFLTLNQRRAALLLDRQLSYSLFNGVPPVPPAPHADVVPGTPFPPIAAANPLRQQQINMLTALGWPIDPATHLPRLPLPTLAEFKDAVLALRSPQLETFWSNVPATEREKLKNLVKSYQNVSEDIIACRNVINERNTNLDGNAGNELRQKIAAYEHMLEHNATVTGILATPQVLVGSGSASVAAALTTAAAARGPIDPAALGNAAHAAVLASAKHDTPDADKTARANEIKAAVVAAAQAVTVEYDAAAIAAPAASAAAVSSEIYASVDVLKRMPVVGELPDDIAIRVGDIATAAYRAHMGALGAVIPPHAGDDPTRLAIMLAVEIACRHLVAHNGFATDAATANSMQVLATVGSLAAAISSKARILVPALAPALIANISDAVVDQYGINRRITEAEVANIIRAQAAAFGPPAVIPPGDIASLAKAAGTACLIAQGAKGAHDSREAAKNAVAGTAVAGVSPGLMSDIAKRISEQHLRQGLPDDAAITAQITAAVNHANDVIRSLRQAGGGRYGLAAAVALPEPLRQSIINRMEAYYRRTGDISNLAQIRAEIAAAQRDYNAQQPAPVPLGALTPPNIDAMAQGVLAAAVPLAGPALVPPLALPPGAQPTLVDLIRRTYEHADANAKGAAAASIATAVGDRAQARAISADVSNELKAGHPLNEAAIAAAKKLPASNDSMAAIAAAALIADSRRIPPPAADLGATISAAYKVGQPPEVLAAATSIAAAAKSAALDSVYQPVPPPAAPVRLPVALASDIAARISNAYIQMGSAAMTEAVLNGLIDAAAAAHMPAAIPVIPEERAKIWQNTVAAYAISVGQQAGEAAVAAHGAPVDAVKVRAIAAISAGIAINFGASATFAKEIAAGLATIYAQPPHQLTDAAIRAHITANPLFVAEFPVGAGNPDRLRENFLNSISKSAREASTLASLDVTSATTLAARAFGSNYTANTRQGYNAKIAAALCAGNNPADIAMASDVAMAGVLACKPDLMAALATRVSDQAAASIAGVGVANIHGLGAAAAGQRNIIAAAAVQAFEAVEALAPANDLPLRRTVRTAVDVAAAAGARPEQATASASLAVAVFASVIKAGGNVHDAENLAGIVANHQLNPARIPAVIKDYINTTHMAIPQEGVDKIVQAAQISKAISAGIEAGRNAVPVPPAGVVTAADRTSAAIQAAALAAGVSAAVAGEAKDKALAAMGNQESRADVGVRAGEKVNGNPVAAGAVAAVAAFFSRDLPMPIAAADLDAQSLAVAQASGAAQVPIHKRVLSAPPAGAQARQPLQQFSPEEIAAAEAQMLSARKKLMAGDPSLPPLKSVNTETSIDLQVLDAKNIDKVRIGKWTIGGEDSPFSGWGPFEGVSDKLKKCVDANGKSFLTVSGLKDAVNALKPLVCDIRIEQKPEGGVRIHFGKNNDFQIALILEAWVKHCQTAHKASLPEAPAMNRGLGGRN